MGSDCLPSPPAEDRSGSSSKKATPSPGTKSLKAAHRAPKRANSSVAQARHHDQLTQDSGMEGRHKRVWKACERCRMKKTKCDGEFPCKKCKDDGLICTAGVRKKVEYKQIPRGYAEVLENTHIIFIATIHKLYNMVRSSEKWDHDEPLINERGLPVIHDIAQKLGCIRPNSDIDLPVHSVFPEDQAGLAELAMELRQQQHQEGGMRMVADAGSFSPSNRTDRSPSCELEPAEFDQDYERPALPHQEASYVSTGSRMTASSGKSNDHTTTVSPRSFSSTDLSRASTAVAEFDSSHAMYFPNYQQQWPHMPQPSPHMAMSLLQQQPGGMPAVDMLSQGVYESDLGTIKPHVLSGANSEVMMGIGDPMMFSGYDGESRPFWDPGA